MCAGFNPETHELPGSSAEATAESALRIWSCVICRRRKVRCDRREPCNNCTKNGIECHFPVTGRLPRRSRDPAAAKPPSQKQAELLGRLRRLEAVVTELSAQVEDGPKDQHARVAGSTTSGYENSISSSDAVGVTSAADQVSVRGTDSYIMEPGNDELDEEFGKLVIDKGGTLQIGKGFWSIFCDEVDNIFQAVQDVVDLPMETDAATPDSRFDAPGSIRSHHQGFLFGGLSANSKDDLSPLPSQMLFIWQTYVEDVDPFIKILHVPSTGVEVRKIRGKLYNLAPDMEALMFAISLAAITSMNEEDVAVTFSVTKPQLLARYRLGTEQALAKAEFLTSKTLTTLQAFVIYLSILPHIGARKFGWPMSGLALRIATSMGLHRESSFVESVGSTLALEDVELRRRLWWQICFIDSQSRDRQAPEMAITEAMFDTRIPAEVNDNELGSPFDGRNLSRTGLKDTTFCLIRCEIWHLNQALRTCPIKTLDEHIRILQSACSRTEETYLRSAAKDEALGSFVDTLARLFFGRLELVIYRQHLRRPTGLADTTWAQTMAASVLSSSIQVIEAVHSLKSNPTWARWRWQLQKGMPWHAVGIVLSLVCRQPWSSLSERGLKSAQKLIDGISGTEAAHPLWQPLSRLMETARNLEAKQLTRLSTGVRHAEPEHPNLQQFSQQVLTPGDTNAGSYRRSTEISVSDSSAAPGTPSRDIFDWDMLQFPLDSALSLPTETHDDGGMIDGQLREDMQPATAPMDWQAWDEMAGTGDSWAFDQF